MNKMLLNKITILATLLLTPLRVRALQLTLESHNAAWKITLILNVQVFKCLGNTPVIKSESL